MILFITRIPPNAHGHGGSQRAMHILKSLAKLDEVDLLLVHRAGDRDSLDDDLRQVDGLVRSALKVELRSWNDPDVHRACRRPSFAASCAACPPVITTSSSQVACPAR